MSFSTAEKLVGYISLKNELQLQKSNYYQSAKCYGISSKREFTGQSVAHVVVIKYRKTMTLSFIWGREDYLSFRLKHASDRKLISSHSKYNWKDKLDISENIDIFTTKDMENTQPESRM